MLIVNIQNAGEAVILKCSGRIIAGEDVATLKRAVLCHQESKELILDFAKVERIDGSGLGLLAFVAGWTRIVGTKLRVLNPTRHVREVLEITNLDSVMEVCSTEEVEHAFRDAALSHRYRQEAALLLAHR